MRGLVLLSLVFISACSRAPHTDDVVARVNGHTITVREFATALSAMKPGEISLSGRARSESKNIILKSLIRRKVVLAEAETLKLALSDQEIEEGIKRYKDGYTNSSFEQSLLEQMVDAAEWRQQVRDGLLIEKLFKRSAPKASPPSLQEALQYYEEHSNLFRKEASSRAMQIVVSDKKMASELLEKVKKNPKLFRDLAKQNSTGPEASSDAIIKVAQGALPPELDGPLFQLRINEISSVIESPYGFHILKVLERQPAINFDFEEVKGQIMAQLVEDHRRQWVLEFEEKLIRSAQIEYNRDLVGRL